jgi:hypothetical protein
MDAAFTSLQPAASREQALPKTDFSHGGNEGNAFWLRRGGTYGVDVPAMQLELHEWGIHAL